MINIGLNVWDGKKLRVFNTEDGLSGNTSFNVYQDSKHRVWIATSKGMTIARTIQNIDKEWIFKFDKVDSENKKEYNVSNILETSKGEIYVWQNFVRPGSPDWPAADFYLAKYNGKIFVEFTSPFPNSLNSKIFQTIRLRENKSGKLWLEAEFADNLADLTAAKTELKIFNDSTWEDPPAEWGIPEKQLHYVGELDNGIYYLTVGEFYKFNGKRFINLSDSVNTNADFTILKGASVVGTKTDIQIGNRLYIRLRNRGLVIFDGTHLDFYTPRDGLISTDIHDPVIDQKGNLYFSSRAGTQMITGNKFTSYYDDISIASGGPNSVIKDGFGNFIKFYNGIGLYVQKGTEVNYPLRISSVFVNSSPYYYRFPAEFSYDENSFLFNYSAFNFQNSDQTTYEHILEGYDKEWSRSSNLSFTEYQNLPTGNFSFRVRGTTGDGIGIGEVYHSFSINPPFWRTWWAYTSYILLLISLFGFIRRFELNRRNEKDKQRLLEAENYRKSEELEKARQLQLSMLPKEIPQLENFDIGVFMKTATEVGGDYYDFHLHENNMLTIILGDATGHGMESGMMVSIIKSLFMSDRSNNNLLSFFTNCNNAIKDMNLGKIINGLNSNSNKR